MKERIKKFVKEHKKGIETIFVIGGATCMVAGAVCFAYGKGYELGLSKNIIKHDGKMAMILNDALDTYGRDGLIVCGTTAEGIKIDAMGKLGEDVFNNILSGDSKLAETGEFTHFIMLGKT